MKYSLGIDIGSSSVKVSLLDVESGKCVASATNPSEEMPILAVKSGWAEQDPEMWWRYIREGLGQLRAAARLEEVGAVGITYQMHGLVPVDGSGAPVRPAIIWCDSRAVEIGREAFEALGKDYCLSHILNSPGNFTATKLAWVRRNEPAIFGKIERVLLPGDYVAWKLSGGDPEAVTTSLSGLSEQMLWDFDAKKPAYKVADYLGIPHSLIPDATPSIGTFAQTGRDLQADFGIPAGTPISYKVGDQPNNAFSLNVLEPGEIAATAGTSGVVYGVTDAVAADQKSRVNTFAHVNYTPENPRYGILLCINGTGILNSWLRRNVAQKSLSYSEMNDLAETVPAGSDGLVVIPFGNGAERVMEDSCPGASINNIDLNRHSTAHILRAAQEGIAFSFRYGIDIMRTMGLKPDVIRAGKANLFLSPLFRRTVSTLSGATIELYNTDGALGAARGAALGCGLYATRDEAFATLTKLETVQPDKNDSPALEEAYSRWLTALKK